MQFSLAVLMSRWPYGEILMEYEFFFIVYSCKYVTDDHITIPEHRNNSYNYLFGR